MPECCECCGCLERAKDRAMYAVYNTRVGFWLRGTLHPPTPAHATTTGAITRVVPMQALPALRTIGSVAHDAGDPITTSPVAARVVHCALLDPFEQAAGAEAAALGQDPLFPGPDTRSERGRRESSSPLSDGDGGVAAPAPAAASDLLDFPAAVANSSGVTVVPIPVLGDNYAYAVICELSGACVLIDVGDSDRVVRVLASLDRLFDAGDLSRCGRPGRLVVTHVLTTHRHWDHSGANAAVRQALHARLQRQHGELSGASASGGAASSRMAEDVSPVLSSSAGKSPMAVRAFGPASTGTGNSEAAEADAPEVPRTARPFPGDGGGGSPAREFHKVASRASVSAAAAPPDTGLLYPCQLPVAVSFVGSHADAPMETTHFVGHGDTFTVGLCASITVLAAPGHTRGSIMFTVECTVPRLEPGAGSTVPLPPPGLPSAGAAGSGGPAAGPMARVPSRSPLMTAALAEGGGAPSGGGPASRLSRVASDLQIAASESAASFHCGPDPPVVAVLPYAAVVRALHGHPDMVSASTPPSGRSVAAAGQRLLAIHRRAALQSPSPPAPVRAPTSASDALSHVDPDPRSGDLSLHASTTSRPRSRSGSQAARTSPLHHPAVPSEKSSGGSGAGSGSGSGKLQSSAVALAKSVQQTVQHTGAKLKREAKGAHGKIAGKRRAGDGVEMAPLVAPSPPETSADDSGPREQPRSSTAAPSPCSAGAATASPASPPAGSPPLPPMSNGGDTHVAQQQQESRKANAKGSSSNGLSGNNATGSGCSVPPSRGRERATTNNDIWLDERQQALPGGGGSGSGSRNSPLGMMGECERGGMTASEEADLEHGGAAVATTAVLISGDAIFSGMYGKMFETTSARFVLATFDRVWAVLQDHKRRERLAMGDAGLRMDTVGTWATAELEDEAEGSRAHASIVLPFRPGVQLFPGHEYTKVFLDELSERYNTAGLFLRTAVRRQRDEAEADDIASAGSPAANSPSASPAHRPLSAGAVSASDATATHPPPHPPGLALPRCVSSSAISDLPPHAQHPSSTVAEPAHVDGAIAALSFDACDLESAELPPMVLRSLLAFTRCFTAARARHDVALCTVPAAMDDEVLFNPFLTIPRVCLETLAARCVGAAEIDALVYSAVYIEGQSHVLDQAM